MTDDERVPADPTELARDSALAAKVFHVRVAGRVWAIDREVLDALFPLDDRSLPLLTTELRRPATGGGRSGVAVIPLKGVLMPMDGLFAMFFGDMDPLGQFNAALTQAVNDDGVGAIVMDVDSPGGLVDHIPETAARIRQARNVKPIVAVANTQADSAAYWLASQADEISVTPSGEVGSIGVYRIHRDLSKAHELHGINPTMISAGRFKTEANPYEPLAAEAASQLQSEVDDYYDMFTADVAKGRNVTTDIARGAQFGEGRAFHAQQAVKAGLANRVETLDATIRRIVSPRGRQALDERRADHAEIDYINDRVTITPAADVFTDDRPVAPVDYTPEERDRLLAVLAS